MFEIKKTKETKDLLILFEILFSAPLFFSLLMIPLNFSEYKAFACSSIGSIFLFVSLICYECAWVISNGLLKGVFVQKITPKACSVWLLIPAFLLLISCISIIVGPSISTLYTQIS